MRKRLLLKKVFYTFFVIFWMMVIFFFSAQPAEVSTDMSESVGQRIGYLCIPNFASWSSERQTAFAEGIDHPLRKCAHATEYAVLSGLFIVMLGSYGIRGRRQILLAFAATVFYAATDEFHQLFVVGRAGMLSDVLIDSCGGAAACAVYYIFCSWRGGKNRLDRVEED